ncbi:hypothetical protein MML48_1g16379 [Holotrichia oblita]|uniref:Uncharacterized protein n=1 Tax=Holotrichia oblita TaxID=644536 RepID=A0ACB9TU91_HOLOL|nr:hypothetical protein MML48_1g16379 [Holotrichia oblita]
MNMANTKLQGDEEQNKACPTKEVYKWENVIDPTERRSSLVRTPPDTYKSKTSENARALRERTASNDNAEDSPWQDEEITSPIYKLCNLSDANDSCTDTVTQIKKKRKRQTHIGEQTGKGTGSNREMTEVATFMGKVYNKTDALMKLVKESTKTKTEIKDMTRELGHIVGILNRKVDILKASYDELTTKSTEYEKQLSVLTDIQMGKSHMEQGKEIARTCCDIGTQVDIRAEGITENEEVRDTQDAQKIWEELGKVASEDHYRQLLDRKWPEQAYRNTRVLVGNPLGADGDLAVYTEDPKMEKGLPKKFRERFPELEEFSITDEEKGNVEEIISITKRKTGTTVQINERYVYKIMPGKGSDEINRPIVFVKMARILAKRATEEGRERIALAVPEHIQRDEARKGLEFAFQNMKLRADLYIKEAEEDRRNDKPKQLKNESTKKSERGLVVVKAGEMTYSDLLKQVKK